MIKYKKNKSRRDGFYNFKDGVKPEPVVATECAKKCMSLDVSCPNKECRNWMEYEDDHNCAIISAYQNGPMTLRQIGDRLGISFVRVKQIEDSALVKIKKRVKKFELTEDYLSCG